MAVKSGGKYAKVLPNLDRFEAFADDPKYRDKVNAKKLEIVAKIKDLKSTEGLDDLVAQMPPTSIDYAHLYVDTRKIKDDLEAELYEANLVIAALTELMTDQYEADAVTHVALDNGRKPRLQWEPHSVVVDREKFRQWCIKTGLETQLMLPWSTTNAITKDLLVRGENEPEGVQAFAKAKIVLG